MTREEYEERRERIRRRYEPLLREAAMAIETARENAERLDIEERALQFELRAYFEAFDLKHQAEEIIAKGEPQIPRTVATVEGR